MRALRDDAGSDTCVQGHRVKGAYFLKRRSHVQSYQHANKSYPECKRLSHSQKPAPGFFELERKSNESDRRCPRHPGNTLRSGPANPLRHAGFGDTARGNDARAYQLGLAYRKNLNATAMGQSLAPPHYERRHHFKCVAHIKCAILFRQSNDEFTTVPAYAGTNDKMK